MSNHLIQKGGIWHVRLDVPADIRNHKDYLNKKVLTRSLKTGDKREANISKLEYISAWKNRFEEIRNSRKSEYWKTEAEKLQITYATQIASSDMPTIEFRKKREEFQNALEEISKSYGLSNTEKQQLRNISERKKEYTNPISDKIIKQFQEHQSSTKVIDKTAANQASTIRKYSKFLEQHKLGLNYESFSKFLKTYNAAYKTLQNKIFAGTSYWKFLTTLQPNLRKEENPFANHVLPKPKKGAPVSKSYIPFTPTEVEQLYKEAIKNTDTTLAYVIKIAAYTGCRIEEICQLKKSSIKKDTLEIRDAKTNAGNRDLPIPDSISELINHLSSTTKDGYLIPSSAGNKYGVRSDSISKRFGRLKKSMNFSNSHVFHSIRKTAATQLEQAGIEETTTMYIIGHDRGNTTFKIYAKGPSHEQKLHALNCIKYNF